MRWLSSRVNQQGSLIVKDYTKQAQIEVATHRFNQSTEVTTNEQFEDWEIVQTHEEHTE
jgi:hypothetical protein